MIVLSGVGHMHAKVGEPIGTQTSLCLWFLMDVRGSVLRSGHDLAVLVVGEVRIESILSIR